MFPFASSLHAHPCAKMIREQSSKHAATSSRKHLHVYLLAGICSCFSGHPCICLTIKECAGAPFSNIVPSCGPGEQ